MHACRVQRFRRFITSCLHKNWGIFVCYQWNVFRQTQNPYQWKFFEVFVIVVLQHPTHGMDCSYLICWLIFISSTLHTIFPFDYFNVWFFTLHMIIRVLACLQSEQEKKEKCELCTLLCNRGEPNCTMCSTQTCNVHNFLIYFSFFALVLLQTDHYKWIERECACAKW